MAGMADFVIITNTATRRRNFYCYTTTKFLQDQAVFFLLVQAYKRDRRKKQAIFIRDWFIDDNIPAALSAKGYLTNVNISAELKGTVGARTNTAMTAVGRTFADKVAKHGGGVSGAFGALLQKAGDTRMPEDLFNAPQGETVKMMGSDSRQGFGDEGGVGATFNADTVYQPLGTFAQQVLLFKPALKTAGFDPEDVGIY